MDSIDEVYNNLDQFISSLLRHLKFLNYYPNKLLSLRSILVFSLTIFVAIQPVIGIYEHFHTWNFLHLVASIDNLIISYGVLWPAIELILLSKKFRKTVSLAKSRNELEALTESNPDIFKQKVNLIKSVTLNRFKTARLYFLAISSYHLNLALISLSEFVFYLLDIKTDEKPPQPHSLHAFFTFPPSIVPKFFDKLFKTSLELFFIYYGTIINANVHIMQSLSISNIVGEMKLFHLNFSEIDEYFEEVLKSENYKNASDVIRKQMENKLRLATINIVKHHQNIFRKVQLLNYGTNYCVFCTNCYLCLEMVFMITMFLKGDSIDKIKYGLIFIGFVLFEFIYNEAGQRLEDEGERMEMTLYDSNWLEKPTWFLQTLKIMMIRSNKLPKVGVLNLFTLNRKNKTEVMRGAYGYFNFLNEFSS